MARTPGGGDQQGRGGAAQQGRGRGRGMGHTQPRDAGRVGDGAAAAAASLQDGAAVRDVRATRGTTHRAERAEAGADDEDDGDDEKDDDLESMLASRRPKKRAKAKTALATLDISPGLERLGAYTYIALMTEAKRREVTCLVKGAKGDAKKLDLAARLHALWDLSRLELDPDAVKNAVLPSIEVLATLGKARLAALVAIRREGLDASKAKTKKLLELLTDSASSFKAQRGRGTACERGVARARGSTCDEARVEAEDPAPDVSDVRGGATAASAPPRKKRGRQQGSKTGGKIPSTVCERKRVIKRQFGGAAHTVLRLTQAAGERADILMVMRIKSDDPNDPGTLYVVAESTQAALNVMDDLTIAIEGEDEDRLPLFNLNSTADIAKHLDPAVRAHVESVAESMARSAGETTGPLLDYDCEGDQETPNEALPAALP